MDQRFQPHASAQEQGAHALGGIELVPRDREKVHAEVVDIHADLADRLGRIGMHERAVRLDDPRDLADGLHRADFIVGVHDADDGRAARQRLADGVRIDQAIAIHGQNGDGAAESAQKIAGLQRGGMLNGARDQVRRRPAAK